MIVNRADDELLTAAEVADILTVVPDTLYGWRTAGVGPKSMKLRRRVVWWRSDVMAWIAEQEQATSRGGAA